MRVVRLVSPAASARACTWRGTSSARLYEVEYRDGVPTGQLTTFFAGGEKGIEGELDQGLPVGRHRIWSDTGAILGEGQYPEVPTTGETGRWKFWRSLPQRNGGSDGSEPEEGR
ncbi:MAG: hypothetical protein R3E96_12395 [Planctomycetota bacterium]